MHPAIGGSPIMSIRSINQSIICADDVKWKGGTALHSLATRCHRVNKEQMMQASPFYQITSSDVRCT